MSATHKFVRTEACSAFEAIALVGDKWTVLVMGALGRQKTIRYNELQRAVGGISQRMLTLTLKLLEENGLVKRTLFPTVPPRVDYELTALGQSLLTPLRALRDWAFENREAMAEARKAYAQSK